MTSEVFRDMLTDQHLGSPKEGTEENPIRIEKISSVSLSQVKAFYKVLNCRSVVHSFVILLSLQVRRLCGQCSGRRFAVEPTLSAQQWSEALQLATIWGFEILRDLAIGYLDCLLNDPLSRIELADGCDIEEWLHPAYAKLCAQEAPLTAKEGRVLGFERFAALCKIREEGFKKGLHLGGNDEMMASHGGTWQQQQGRSGPTREFPVCQHRCCKPPVELSGREKVFLTVVSGTEDL